MSRVLFLALAACGSFPPSICDSQTSDEAVTKCVVDTFNKFAGCQMLSGSIDIVPTGISLTVNYVSHVDSAEGQKYGGLTSGNSIQIEHKADPDYYIEATELMHELGHVFGLRYKNNPSDPTHSQDPNDIMYEAVNTPLNTQNMASYMEQLKSQNLVQCN